MSLLYTVAIFRYNYNELSEQASQPSSTGEPISHLRELLYLVYFKHFSGQISSSGKGAKQAIQLLLKHQPIKHEPWPDYNTGSSALFSTLEVRGFFNIPCKP